MNIGSSGKFSLNFSNMCFDCNFPSPALQQAGFVRYSMGMQWRYLSKTVPKSHDELIQVLLENRKINDKSKFFSPPHPNEIALKAVFDDVSSIKKATKRIQAAAKTGESILIYGDYDADGICATALLWQALYDMGCKVKPFIPHRSKHGYGLSVAAIDEILVGEIPKIIITVDNGITAHTEVSYLKEKGIEVIVTDHHQPEVVDGRVNYPPADLVLHTTKLCGTTVAWVLARELNMAIATDLLDLCGLATIADLVPVLAENRSFAKFGLEALKKTKNLGILALLQLARIPQEKINEGAVGFALAPRINAMGRLYHGMDALRLLCTKNKQRARELALKLSNTNSHRQDLTQSMLADARTQIQTLLDEHLLIVWSEQYHEGVLGLIAGGLVEEFHKPAIAISVAEGLAKGSARSVAGVNIVELLREVRDDLLTVGGHPMAAGFGLEASRLYKVRTRLLQLARKRISKESLVQALDVECELPTGFVSDEFVEIVQQFAPFGVANPQPIFVIRQAQVARVDTIGADGSHLKLVLMLDQEDDQPISFTAMGWRMGELAGTLHIGDVISVAGTLEFNEWNGRKKLQIVLKDLQSII